MHDNLREVFEKNIRQTFNLQLSSEGKIKEIGRKFQDAISNIIKQDTNCCKNCGCISVNETINN